MRALTKAELAAAPADTMRRLIALIDHPALLFVFAKAAKLVAIDVHAAGFRTFTMSGLYERLDTANERMTLIAKCLLDGTA